MSEMSPTAQRNADPAAMKAYRAEMYQRTKDRVRAKARAKYATDTEFQRRNRQAALQWYRDNPERAKERQAENYRANRAAYLQRSRAFKLQNPQKYMWDQAKHRAKRSNIEFTISASDIVIPELCPVFGVPLRLGDARKHDFSPSLDRVDNLRGYVPGNVIVVSLLANRIKTNATPSQIRAVADFYSKLQEAQVSTG